jgi:hypothetical protein
MPAAVCRIVVENGVQNLSCPICASPVFTEDEGVQEQACAHVLFLVDWVGELCTFARPQGDVFGERLNALYEISETDDDALVALAAELPPSALLMTIEQPAHGGGHDGSSCSVAFDFALS